MKILILSDVYPPYRSGGHQIQTKVVVDKLSEKGHEICVLTSKYKEGKKIHEEGIYRYLNFCSCICSKGIKRRVEQLVMTLLFRANYFITIALVKKIKPDVIYVGYLGGISMFPIRAIQKLDIPIVYHAGSYLLVEYMEQCIMEPNLIKSAWRKFLYGFHNLDEFNFQYMITNSEALKKDHVSVGFSENNISVIRRGLPLSLLSEKHTKNTSDIFPGKQTKILYVGRLMKKKEYI